MIRKIAAALLGCVFFFNACYYDKEELLYPGNSCATLNVSYKNDIEPIINTRCAVPLCHGAGFTNGPGPLINYDAVRIASIEIKSAVVSGFMPAEVTTIGAVVEPAHDPLTANQIKRISCWVDSGSPNN